MRTLLLLGILIGVVPTPVMAACSCMLASLPGTPVPRLWPPLEAPVLFAGRALAVDTLVGAMRVRFAVDSSWRNPLPHTLTVEYRDDAPCAHFVAGGSYLVGAVGQLIALRLPPCGEGIRLTSGAALPRLLRGLGMVTWRAPPVGQRQLDRFAYRIGASPPSVGAGDSVIVSLSEDTSVVRIEIANLSPTFRSQSAEVRLPSGLYLYRITRNDGSMLESYVEVRCERRRYSGGCGALRMFLGR